jgi:hypothetical protein
MRPKSPRNRSKTQLLRASSSPFSSCVSALKNRTQMPFYTLLPPPPPLTHKEMILTYFSAREGGEEKESFLRCFLNIYDWICHHYDFRIPEQTTGYLTLPSWVASFPNGTVLAAQRRHVALFGPTWTKGRGGGSSPERGGIRPLRVNVHSSSCFIPFLISEAYGPVSFESQSV